VELADETATQVLAAAIARLARPGDLIALSGPLGAGKTSFARAFVRSLIDAAEEVPSPTFTLMQTYDGLAVRICHVDLYRLSGPDDLAELGLDEAFQTAIVLVEWPDRMDRLPADRIEVALALDDRGTDRRTAILTGHGRWAGLIGQVIV